MDVAYGQSSVADSRALVEMLATDNTATTDGRFDFVINYYRTNANHF